MNGGARLRRALICIHSRSGLAGASPHLVRRASFRFCACQGLAFFRIIVRASRLTQSRPGIRWLSDSNTSYERKQQADGHHLCPAREASFPADEGVFLPRPYQVAGAVSQALQRVHQVAGKILGEAGEERTALVQAVEEIAAMGKAVRHMV